MRFPSSLVLCATLLGVVSLAQAQPGPWGDRTRSKAYQDQAGMLRLQAAPLVDDGAKLVQQQRLAGIKAPGRLDVLVMRCDFADSLMLGRHGEVPGDFPAPTQSEIYYVAHDSVYFDHLLGQVRDYYTDVSGGALTIDFTIHPTVINLPEGMAFYGDHPDKGEQTAVLADDVLRALDAEVDFSQYDTFVLVHAGAGEETDIYGQNPEQIFSTYIDPADFAAAHEDGDLEFPYIPSDDFPEGTGIDRVLVLPECEHQAPIGYFGSLGVYCFEFGLHLGMLSLSDFTPAGRPDSQGIGEFGLMGYGLFNGIGFVPPHPVAFNKLLMGWIDPYDLDPDLGNPGLLTPYDQPGDPSACARVDITGQEYWLLTYRRQDPDGDRIYTHPDDKNGNNIPDFWDADSPTGDGVPEYGVSKFDPETDEIEKMLGGEWDFYMSEWVNSDGRTVKGTGSGAYVWHIDEGVVQEVFDSPTNLFNADPSRKSVDLEEADGIQDLDSNQGSNYMLGWEKDAFRGEGASEFGPATLPPTDTNGGAATGVTFGGFTDVVVDSTSYPVYHPETGEVWYYGYEYAETMGFEISRQAGAGTGGADASVTFPPGTDLRGSHALVAQLDGPGMPGQIVLGANDGQVFVLDGELADYLETGDPDVPDPFVVGLRGGAPVTWNLPPAVGDVDHDGVDEIVLTANEGLYVFRRDGTPLVDGPPEDFGLYAGLNDCGLPPVLIPNGLLEADTEPGHAAVVVVDRTDGQSNVRIFFGSDAAVPLGFDLGEVAVPAPPVLVADHLVTALADTAGGDHHLMVTPLYRPSESLSISLNGEPGAFAPTWGVDSGSPDDDPTWYVMVTGRDGGGETVSFRSGPEEVGLSQLWNPAAIPASPVVAGGAAATDGAFGRLGQTGNWLDGWPQRPMPSVSISDPRWAASPLVVHLLEATEPLNQYLFTADDGRIYGYSSMGEAIPGWPLGGPGASAGSPAVGPLAGDPAFDLVAIGTFDRISGLDDSGEDLQTEALSTVSLWLDLAGEDPVWSAWGGGPWRNGVYEEAPGLGPAPVAEGTGLVPGSHICYPSPLLDGPLKVRGVVRADARARVFVYNLEGEEVKSTDWRQVPAVAPFDLEIDLAGIVSGLYLCRLVVDTDGAETDQSVVQFAVVR